MPPHGIAQIGLVILGTLAAPALAFVGIRTYGAHPIPGAAAILLGTAALLPAIPLGLGWVGHGLDPSTLPRATQAFGAGGVISTIFLCVAGALLIARSSDRSLPAARRRRALTHSVAVHDVRPDPGDPKNRFEPYFVALCDCGWVGEPRETAAEAFEDARRHSPKVAAEIRRPVG